AFNYVWRVDRLRSISRRFSNYLSVLLVGPVLIFTALGITASVMNTALVQKVIAIEPFGTGMVFAGKFVPYLLVIAAFTFVYQFIPNTRVRFRAAAVGGLLAGMLWETTGWAFALFIATSSNYAAIYSSFAILILLLIWMYLNWLILLFGAQIAFYVQNPRYVTLQPVRLHMSNRLKEKMALLVMYLVAYNHHHDLPPWTEETLAERIGAPVGPLQRLLALLTERGFLLSTADDPPGHVPARDIETILLSDLVASVREAEESDVLAQDQLISITPVNQVVNRLQSAMADALANYDLKSMVQAGEESK
ncbi:MAG: YihY/virulence factor BrkB family protein, partial [Gammaproteobacteria bacterium]